MAKFGDRLSALRKERGLTQDELAKRLEVTKSAISMYENGKRTPDYEILELIADYFNVDMDYLVGRKDEKHTPYSPAADFILNDKAIAFYRKMTQLSPSQIALVESVIDEMLKRRD